MATINSVNRWSKSLYVFPETTSDDAFIRFDINGSQKYIIGIDDDDNHYFKLSYGGSFGTNDLLVSNGSFVTYPYQPAFSVSVSSPISNITGDGTVYGAVIFDTIDFDQNSDYDDNNGVFVAPVSGKYMLSSSITLTGISSSMHRMYVDIVTSNRTYRGAMCDPYDIGISSYLTTPIDVFADLDAGDTASISVMVSGGTKVADVYGDSNAYSFFSGFLGG